MVNLAWGGVESSQVGTAEFIDLCRRAGADPLININFESDGRSNRARPRPGVVRSAGPREAAEWVDYCNNPGNALRRRHGRKDPYDVRLWQIGNETLAAREKAMPLRLLKEKRPARRAQAADFSTLSMAGLTGLEPATSGVTGRRSKPN